MDRNSILRVVVIAAALILFWKFGLPLITGSNDKPQQLVEESYVNAPGFVPDRIDPPAEPGKPNEPNDGALCKIDGIRFDATLAERGAGIKTLRLEGGKYEGMDLSTTPDHERWRSLRTLFRGGDATSQMKYDRVPWKLDASDGKSCTFRYEDDDVRIVKRVAAGLQPFELVVDTTITNLAKEPRRHQMKIATFAFHQNKDMKGSLGRVSPWQTELSCAGGKDVVRKNKDEFKSGPFQQAGVDRYAAVNSHYFSQSLIPSRAEGAVTDLPSCELLAQDVFAPSGNEDENGAVFHAKLVYPARELGPNQAVTYQQVVFTGPKERDVLASAGGGNKLNDVLNLGFFTPVAKVLVGVLRFFHDKVTGNWGIAIILMTICLRTLLFPLTWKSIKTTIAMRKLKPDVDALNEKFKDDAQAKNLAMMELWKKHGVNPFGGCLPQLVQMPVWFAMYTTLQTAVEMYHVKFLWFADLSSPDKFYILPLLLGAFMILQQRIVPQQPGMDPMQQKMMMWMLPIVFTVMMLFLPAALGVYMLTNSMLGIAQQLAVEQIAPRGDNKKDIVVKVKGPPPGDKGGGNKKTALARGGANETGEGLGKGKARV
jgi:YidC/Oxa1 family membrane protein insertase